MKKFAFLDIDTQFDFMVPEGRLYVQGADKLLPGIARIAHFIGENKLAILGSYDWHKENDPEFKVFPKHCVEMTHGAMPVIDIEGEKMMYFEKVTPDLFTNPEADKVIKETAATYIVFGVALDICVKAAIDGLLARGKKVWLIVDLTESINPEKGHQLIEQWIKKGVEMQFLDKILKMDPDKLKEVAL